MQLLIRCGAVALAGSAGSVLRFLVAVASNRIFGADLSFIGTFIINMTGSLFLGWFITVIQTRIVVTDTLRIAIATGFVGAYTTFSTFMFESNKLIHDGSEIRATLNIVGSLMLGLAAVRLGIWLASR